MRALLLAAAAATRAGGEPVVALMKAACPGVAAAKQVDMKGAFTLHVDATGATGYTYSCAAKYQPHHQTADKECAGWLPQAVTDGKEDLDITLQALDSAGKLAVCMKWKLVWGGGNVPGAWAPPGADLKIINDPQGYFNMMKRMDPGAKSRANIDGGQVTANNTKDTRALVYNAYLDSMTFVSHACVPTTVNNMLYPADGGLAHPGYNKKNFPPGVSDLVLAQASHKLLAISGTIHSIDRKCHQWSIGTSESCVAFPTLHCHSICQMTWHLGPGGVSKWGTQHLMHHIPSPGINVVEMGTYTAADYGDLGCGGAVPPKPPPPTPTSGSYACVVSAGSKACSSVPAGFPGAYATLSACQANCK